MRTVLLHVLFLLITLSVMAIYLYAGNPDSNIILRVRLPGLLLTVLTGVSLAGIGSVYQMMLNNPLAEPYILGISSGAALGSVIFAVLGLTILMPLGGFSGAMLTMLVVWTIAQHRGRFDRTRLLLSGIIAGMFFSAAISLIMYLFHKDTLLILGVLMGNLGRIFTYGEWYTFLGLGVLGVLLLADLYRRSLTLDIMSQGDMYAASVGIRVHRVRREIFVVSSLLLGIIVSYAGIIGFVGLIIPHIVRRIFPSGQRQIYLYSLWAGGTFLLLSALIARHLTVLELPVGVVTAFIGCPFFVLILLRRHKTG
ncbi:MAG: iron ABC transporter permease [Candidatus Cloacimonetes bacterium]|nr:iron ABC transporter permease [Candidatus Cloacimonadota bacterium]